MMALYRQLFALMLSGLAFAAMAQQQAAEVYRDDNIVIAAAVVEAGRKDLHFGDPLTLVVQIRYDDERVRLPEPDSRMFASAWSDQEGAFLKEIVAERDSVSGELPVQDNWTFRFQIMACPAAQALCRGDRLYAVPEFSLAYELIDEEGAVTGEQTAVYRPGPENFTVFTSLQLGEEGELLGFQSYFPNGAYPSPLSGVDNRYPSIGVIAGALLLLMGGVLMSPFSFFKRKVEVTRNSDRWEPVLDQLRAGAFADDARQIDAMRRCLVWYCTDKLGVDPFYWVKHEEEVSGEKQKGGGELAPYRELFHDILLSPRGQGQQLLDRLTRLVGKAR